jgi:hypothetical protein
MTTNTQFGQIIEREFRKAANLPAEARVSVTFPNEDEIVVTANDVIWTHQNGGEIDAFMFENRHGEMVDFEPPADWIELGFLDPEEIDAGEDDEIILTVNGKPL